MSDVPYHAHTHRPKAQGGTDPIEIEAGRVPWVVLWGGATTAPAAGTEMPIPFEVITWDQLLVTKDGDYFDWVITDDGDTGNDRFEVILKKRGWYSYELKTQWDQTTTGGANSLGYAVQFISADPPTGFYFDEFPIKQAADWFDVNYEEGLFEMLEDEMIESAGRLWKNTDADRQLKPTARQWTGVNRGLSGLFLKVWYEGALGGTLDSIDWGFESV